ncbi:unnamed protein product [Peronospora destructor]|uniref:Uncharacterized protein n=1 Tax=Peronospora destructor TaxID=86335 RepID=A0AAV0UDD1_9STRA|nr:unnamed protein product [Peronospora destructor]
MAGFSSSRTHEVSVFSGHENRTSLISDKTASASIGKRKRRQEKDRTVGETTRIKAGSIANCNFTDAKAFFTKPPAPTSGSASQRRLSYFITRSLAPDKPKQDTEKSSECKQQ